MIRHICMFKLKEENKENNIAEFLERAESLKALKEIKRFEAVRNSKDTPASNYDVSLIFDFETVDNLNGYQTADVHVKFADFVASVKTERACIDYEFWYH